MDPLSLGLAGVGLAKSLFGRKKKYSYTPRKFTYTPDENDAELGLRRSRALRDISRGKANTVNEIGRAGLLGTSAQFGIMGDQETEGQHMLEDITGDVFAKRRREALDLFRDEEDYYRKRALLSDESGFRENEMGLSALGDIGSFLGGDLEDLLGYKKKALGDTLLEEAKYI